LNCEERAPAGKSFTLFVSGNSPNSQAAIANLNRALGAIGLRPDDVELVDVAEQPDRAESARILVTPTLVRHGAPNARMVGDLSSGDRLNAFVR
jgi:circadian clock protein KaiB